MLAAVDWEDDGDLDCLCGTADGKLMLLRNPKVGRPTNLKATAGVDNVLLTWDPNQQSRVRGYKVYRREGTQATAETQATDDGYVALVSSVSSVSSASKYGRTTLMTNSRPAISTVTANSITATFKHCGRS